MIILAILLSLINVVLDTALLLNKKNFLSSIPLIGYSFLIIITISSCLDCANYGIVIEIILVMFNSTSIALIFITLISIL